jgi:hypothetical protein
VRLACPVYRGPTSGVLCATSAVPCFQGRRQALVQSAEGQEVGFLPPPCATGPWTDRDFARRIRGFKGASERRDWGQARTVRKFGGTNPGSYVVKRFQSLGTTRVPRLGPPSGLSNPLTFSADGFFLRRFTLQHEMRVIYPSNERLRCFESRVVNNGKQAINCQPMVVLVYVRVRLPTEPLAPRPICLGAHLDFVDK